MKFTLFGTCSSFRSDRDGDSEMIRGSHDEAKTHYSRFHIGVFVFVVRDDTWTSEISFFIWSFIICIVDASLSFWLHTLSLLMG